MQPEQQRILIVEDEYLIALEASKTLQRQGFNVCGILATGEEAVDCARKLSPDFILMDIGLKGRMDGIEAVRTIRQFSHIPVVFISAYDIDERRSRACSLEMQPAIFLAKPLNQKILMEAIHAVGRFSEQYPR